MKIYTVGGFCRDTLLGLDPHDRDYVVVGSSEAEMESLGFTRVGDELLGFPVFLHPETKEEYALARKERKVDVGYSGFEVDISPPLNKDLLKKFKDLGYLENKEYPIEELIDIFQRITQ